MASSCFRSTTKFDIDIDELIREVHFRPAIWNKNFEGHYDRRLRARMWDEVCENIINNWKKLKTLQQNVIANEVQKKWRNVKDAFNKEMKRRTTGQNMVKKRLYRHYKALSFLMNSKNSSKIADCNYESDGESDNTSVDQENTSASISRKRNRSRIEDEDENLLEVKREKIHSDEENSNSEHNRTRTDKEDNNRIEIDIEELGCENAEFSHKKAQNSEEYPDRHFEEINCDDWDNEVLSKNSARDVKVYDEDISFSEMMVPMLRRLNDDQKHFAKIEILNILHKAKRHHPSSSRKTLTEKDRSGCNEEDG